MLRCRTVLKRDSNSTNLTSDHPYRAPAVTCELLHLGGWVGLASLMIWVLGPPPCKAGRAGTHPFCSCTLATFECFQINFNFGGADARRLTGGGPAPQTTAAVECPTLWSTHLNRFEPPRSYCASVRCPTSQFQIYLKVVHTTTGDITQLVYFTRISRRRRVRRRREGAHMSRCARQSRLTRRTSRRVEWRRGWARHHATCCKPGW